MASCRIGLVLLALLAAPPALAETQSLLQVIEAKPFPNLAYKDGQGKARRLARDLGKLTIVHFWATWCEPCVDEFPKLDELHKAYASRGLKVIAISMDGIGNVKKVREFYDKHHIETTPAYLDTGSNAYKTAKTRGLPTSFFINASGMKIAIAEGPLEWGSKDVLGFVEFQLRAAE